MQNIILSILYSECAEIVTLTPAVFVIMTTFYNTSVLKL